MTEDRRPDQTRRFFGGRPAVGRTLEIDGQRFRVVGVVRDIPMLRIVPFADVWVPIAQSLGAPRPGGDPWWRDPNVNGFQVVLRPAPDAHLLDTSEMDIEAAFLAAKTIIEDVMDKRDKA